MVNSRYINIIVVFAVTVAVLFTAVFMFAPQVIGIKSDDSEPDYIGTLFDDTKMNMINIEMDESDWQQFLADAMSEEYTACDLTINGTTYKNVGIRCKGNTSLSQVDNDKYSFKFKADKYVSDQSFDGLDEFVVNNIIQDATYMKEYISYDLLSYIGVPVPAMAYYDVYVNGEEWGVYLALEALEEQFVNRNFDPDNNDQLYKVETVSGGMPGGGNGERPEFPAGDDGAAPIGEIPEGENMPSDSEAGGRNRADFPAEEGIADGNIARNGSEQKQTENDALGEGIAEPNAENSDENDKAESGMMRGFNGEKGSSGASLEYTDDEIDSYSDIFDYAKFDPNTADKKRMIEAIKALNTGEDIEEYWNVDEIIRYFAANTAMVNLDSYVSQLVHNYYLYEEDGCVSVIPWDYNLSFGAFQSASADSSVNFPIDTPVTSEISMEERPLLNMIFNNEEYLEKYHEYLRDIAENYFIGGRFETNVKKLEGLLSDYIKNQNAERAFYTYDEYLAAVEMFKDYCTLRTESIIGQLDGLIPSTYEDQQADSSGLIDASSVDMSVMGGTQGHNGKENGERSGGFRMGMHPGVRANEGIVGERENQARENPPAMPQSQ